jgi:hypothetical protein
MRSPSGLCDGLIVVLEKGKETEAIKA